MKRIPYFGLLRFLLVVCLSINIAFSQEKPIQLENRADALNYQWNRASLESSVELFSQAAEEWKHAGNIEKTAACFRRIGEIKILLGEKKSAVDFFQKARKILRNTNFPAEKTRVLSDLSKAKLALGKSKESEKY